MAHHEWVGLYLPEDDGEPVALFRDGTHAHHLQMQVLNRPDAVRAAVEGPGVHKDVRALFRAAAEALEAEIEAQEREAMGLPARAGAPKVPDKTAEALGIGEAPERAPAKR